MTHQLAQVNFGRIRYTTDDDRMHGFMSRLDEINALAEVSPGFVWRFVEANNNATDARPDESDDMLLINFSVWESVDALHHYTYKTAHAELFKDRKLWFEAVSDAYMVLWWVPIGTLPTIEDCNERLAHLQLHGPTPYAFTFKQRFEPSDLTEKQ